MVLLRRAFLIVFATAAAIFAVSCDGFFVSENATQSLSVSPSAAILQAAPDNVTPGDSTNLAATQNTVGGANNTVTSSATWSSSDSTIATVSAGTVTVVGTAGGSTATITATFEGKSATCNVLTFTGSVPSTITVNYPNNVTASTLVRGQQFQLTVTATLNGATTDITQYVTWSSNASSAVATISSSGLVTVQSTAPANSSFTVTATANLANNTSVPGTSSTFTVP